MKKLILILSLLVMKDILFCQSENNNITPLPGMRGKPINLPDISSVVNSLFYFSDEKEDKQKNRLHINEVEVAFQSYIYPDIKGNLILALHKHEDSNHYETEVCQANASFLNLGYNLSADIGRTHIDFGKLNKVHTHHLPMIERPLVLRSFLGEHELIGDGVALKYLLGFLPFFSQFQIGYWNVLSHSHEEDEAEVLDINGSTISVISLKHTDRFSPSDKIYSFRWNSSFEIGTKKEIEIGFSALKGRGSHFREHKDNIEIYGVDLTFSWFISSYSRVKAIAEALHLRRKIPVGKLKRDGFYVFLNYRLNKYWDLGLRGDYSENPFPSVEYNKEFSFIVTKHLNETTYLRFTAKNINEDRNKITQGWVQFSFGFGPHSHELE